VAQFLIENYDTVTKFSIATSGQRKIFYGGTPVHNSRGEILRTPEFLSRPFFTMQIVRSIVLLNLAL